MSEHHPTRAAAEARHREYVELVEVILHSRWRPGDLIRTSSGAIWLFHPVSYTSDFPDAEEPLGPDAADGHAPASQGAQGETRSVHRSWVIATLRSRRTARL